MIRLLQRTALRKTRGAILAVGLGALTAAPALAAQQADKDPSRFELGDFKLENGQVIENGFLTYVTHGTLNEERNNAILVLPALMADHRRHDFLIGPGKALDPAKYFIIATDTLGNGRAISPSNSKTQPGPDFPQFSIRDMVDAQHKLVTQGLELDRLLAVIGVSMGGMQTYEWAARYPDMMTAAVPIVSMGRTTPWVTAIWESQRQAIMTDPAWAGGKYETPPEKGLRAAAAGLELWVRNWDWIDSQFKDKDNKDVVDWLDNEAADIAKQWDANDFIWQTRAEDLHDIAKGGNYAAALHRIAARTLLMPSTRDIFHPPADSRFAAKNIPNAKLVEIDSPLGHLVGTEASPKINAFINKEIAKFLHEVFTDRVKI